MAGAKAANQASLICSGSGESSCPRHGTKLGGAGLAGHLCLGDRARISRSAGHDTNHQFRQLHGRLLRHHPDRLRFGAKLAVCDYRRGFADSPVGDGLSDHGHLQWGGEDFALANRADPQVQFVSDLGGMVDWGSSARRTKRSA